MRVNDFMKQQGRLGVDVLVLDDLELRRLQLNLLEIADDVIAVFNELDVEWTLSGGTVLGAARHQGFIPWDDDIDLNITRFDWDRCKYRISEMLGEKYRLYSPEFDTKCTVNQIKVIKKGTVLRELNSSEDEALGIFVDIFIVENVPNNCLLRKVNGFLSQGLRYICSCVRMSAQKEHLALITKDNSEAKKGFMNRVRIGQFCAVIPLRIWLKNYMSCNALCKDSNSNYVTIPTGSKFYFGELIKRDAVFPPVKLEFEGRFWNVPRNYDCYLTNLYGNWRSVPPVEKRERHLLLELKYGDENE